MVDVDMNPTPPKIIEKEACLQAKGPSKLSKDLRPKGIHTLERRRNQKK
jgi:hypothetical protein